MIKLGVWLCGLPALVANNRIVFFNPPNPPIAYHGSSAECSQPERLSTVTYIYMCMI